MSRARERKRAIPVERRQRFGVAPDRSAPMMMVDRGRTRKRPGGHRGQQPNTRDNGGEVSSFSTESLSDHDREALAVLMADNPEFAAKLADAVAEKVGEKLGEKLVQIGWIMADVEKRLEKIDDKLEEHDRRLDTLLTTSRCSARSRISFPESCGRSTDNWTPSTLTLTSTPTRGSLHEPDDRPEARPGGRHTRDAGAHCSGTSRRYDRAPLGSPLSAMSSR